MSSYQRALYAVLLVGAVALFALTLWNYIDLKNTKSDLEVRRGEAELLKGERARLEAELRVSSAGQKRLLELLESVRGDTDAVRRDKLALEKKVVALEQKNQEMTPLCQERDLLAKEKEDLTARVDALAKQEAALREELKTKELDATKVQEGLAALVARLGSNEVFLRESIDEIKELTNSNARLTSELAALHRTLDTTRADLTRAEALAEEYRRQLDPATTGPTTGSTRPPATSPSATKPKPELPTVEPPAEPIVAKVHAADLEVGMVVIGAGLDEGVKRGMSFWIYDGDEVIAALRATRLQKRLTGCIIVSRGDGEIRVGDMATTEKK